MPPSLPAIFVLGCFDTKGEVFGHLRERLLAQGEPVVFVNAGIFGSSDLFPVDIEAGYLASLGGSSLEELRDRNDRAHALEVMARGAGELFRSFPGQIKGVIGMGGGGGTYMVLSAMQVLPLGLPKICISTLATRDVSHLVGVKDIVLIPSVVDVAGLNAIIRPIIHQAAAALSAMSEVVVKKDFDGKGTVAISMFGNTTDCVNECTRILQENDYEVMAFHANGVGGKAMEALIREGVFDGVLDLTTTELADELCGGILSAGPGRLTAAAEMGIPCLLAPGCLDMVNFGARERIPGIYENRLFYQWAPDVTLMRTNEQENAALGNAIAEKLNTSKNKTMTKVVIPLKGFSQLDAPGNHFHNEECTSAFVKSLASHLDPQIEQISVAVPINNLAFAKEAADIFLGMLDGDKRNS